MLRGSRRRDPDEELRWQQVRAIRDARYRNNARCLATVALWPGVLVMLSTSGATGDVVAAIARAMPR
jgi:hypothetical protein